ncbi:MAG TPA: hypothetical protein DCY27_06045 [Desulfobacterales bacterium]|nr:hypothetical protein [Desulfobacterales bacterium]
MKENRTTADREIPIKCPVCPFPETTRNPCPQCGTDLEPLRWLRRLPQMLEEEAFSQSPQGTRLGSIAYLATAAVLDPASMSSRLALARALLEGGNLEEAQSTVRQILELNPEHPEAQELERTILESERRRAGEARIVQEAAWRTARWKFSALTASTATLVLLTLFIWQPFTSLPPSSKPVSTTDQSRQSQPADAPHLSEKPLIFIDPKFPMVRIERDQEVVRLSGEVKTFPELLQILKQTSKVHRLNLDDMKVKYEHSFPYRVRPHDTLTSLARRFYGQGAKWTLIQEANAPVLKNPDLLKQGEQLLIPGPPRILDGMAPDPDNLK